MTRLLSRPPRILRQTFALTVCAGRYWTSDNASTTGAALAFYCAFSLAPLLVILFAISGWVVGATAAHAFIGAQLSELFGVSTAQTLLGAAINSQQMQGVWATVVSVVTLLVSATTVLAALQTSLDQIWESSASLIPQGWRGWLRTRFLSLGFILTLGFLLLVSLTVTTAIAHLREGIAHEHAALVGAIGLLDTALSLLLVASLFALIFRYMPARRLPWKKVAGGGLLTAMLFDLGRWVIGLYLAHSTQPTAFGAAASFVALLLWLYYTSQIFLFGAEFTACLAGIRGNEEKVDKPARPALPSRP